MNLPKEIIYEIQNNWDFIEKYYPNYYSCDDILLFDIFTRKQEGEFICKKDEILLKALNVKDELINLNKIILAKTINNYLKINAD